MKRLIVLRNRENEDEYVHSAFIGFQLGAGGDKNFGDYLRFLGLSADDQSPTEDEPVKSNEMNAKAAIAKAEAILEMARKKQE